MTDGLAVARSRFGQAKNQSFSDRAALSDATRQAGPQAAPNPYDLTPRLDTSVRINNNLKDAAGAFDFFSA